MIIRTDGGARGNPGPAGAGIVITDGDGQTLFAGGFFLGHNTNNQAEYEAILRAIKLAEELGGTHLEIYSDSELIVKQINGQYRVKKPHLKEYYRQIIESMEKFDSVTVQHVYRCENVLADELVNRAIDAKADVPSTHLGQSKPHDQQGSTDSDTGQEFIYTAELTKMVKFSPTGPCRVILSRQGKLSNEMICLQPSQQYRFESKSRQTVITIMRGRGTVKAGSESHTVMPGSWLYLGHIALVEFNADSNEQLVAILTHNTVP